MFFLAREFRRFKLCTCFGSHQQGGLCAVRLLPAVQWRSCSRVFAHYTWHNILGREVGQCTDGEKGWKRLYRQ